MGPLSFSERHLGGLFFLPPIFFLVMKGPIWNQAKTDPARGMGPPIWTILFRCNPFLGTPFLQDTPGGPNFQRGIAFPNASMQHFVYLVHLRSPCLLDSFTCVHLCSPVFTCVHLCSPVFTCVHLRSPAFTLPVRFVHLCSPVVTHPPLKATPFCLCHLTCSPAVTTSAPGRSPVFTLG